MTQRQRIDLLDHPRRGLASHLCRLGRPPRIMMGLLLIIDQLLFPSLVIKNNQFFSRIKLRVKEIRDQHMSFTVSDSLRVVQCIADHPDDDPIPIDLTVVATPINLRQPYAIRQVLDRLEDQAAFTRANSWTPRNIAVFQWS